MHTPSGTGGAPSREVPCEVPGSRNRVGPWIVTFGPLLTISQSSDDRGLGRYLRARRLELGLSQADAAELARISETTWRNVERGRHTPRSATLDAIAAALQTDRRALARLITAAPALEPEATLLSDTIGVECGQCRGEVDDNGVKLRPAGHQYVKVRQQGEERERNVWAWPFSAGDGFVPTIYYCSLECAVRGMSGWLTGMTRHMDSPTLRVELTEVPNERERRGA